MQFNDQASAYLKKSISLEQAALTGRAKLTLAPGAEKIGLCFRPEPEIAKAFDARDDARLKLKDLTTPAKVDLLINDLLPDFSRRNVAAYGSRQLERAAADRR